MSAHGFADGIRGTSAQSVTQFGIPEVHCAPTASASDLAISQRGCRPALIDSASSEREVISRTRSPTFTMPVLRRESFPEQTAPAP
jgi:hypothetical protein